MSEQETEKKIVWITCRANEKCPGRKAEISFARAVGGALDSDTSGRLIRYKCCTCGQSFHVRQ